jgi:hypothetical protein
MILTYVRFSFVDPTLEHALDSDKPWALSPLISTMPYFAIHRGEQAPKKIEPEDSPAFASSHGSYLRDDVSELESIPQFKTPSSRRQYFSTTNHRKEVTFKSTVSFFLRYLPTSMQACLTTELTRHLPAGYCRLGLLLWFPLLPGD